ncbi:polysaccharide pyruvyl transferase family protein [Bermanella marisrubri]|nr:polysaccharide pyruvyl transferase family protein [Bermanella marisrubri]
MEFGNIGNYYIIEPFMRELHRVFPNASIKTTMQMSERFCEGERVTLLPMNLYYGWTGNDLEIAQEELKLAEAYAESGCLKKETPYIQEVMQADLVIDFSGDIWGDNANFLGDDRFLVGLIKDRVAQLLGKKVVMLAGSPGPFSNKDNLPFAREVFKCFDLITNREPISIDLLKKDGFDTSKTLSLACPAFLFDRAEGADVDKLLSEEGLRNKDKPIVGFILCGWNFEVGPFDKENRDDEDFTKFAETVEYLTEELGVRVCLMSHSNGFDIPPAPFKLKHGRDYVITKQLEKILDERSISKDFFTLNGVYDTWTTKAIINEFDMLVSGRVHAAVSGLSQSVPTVIIDYGHEPKAHKLVGFAKVAQVEEYVADPCSLTDLKTKVFKCYSQREQYKESLNKRIPVVKKLARQNFEVLKSVLDQ